MLKNYVENGCITAPGLAIGGSTTTFKYGNTFRVKCNGIISDATTTADAAALTTATLADGSVAGDLAIDYCRIYTLLAAVDDDGAVTFSIVAGADFPETRAPRMSDVNLGDGQKAIVGIVILVNTTNVFDPGTTALSASGVTAIYIDNIIGMMGM